ncbi:RecQ family ATP-dependent DNA helicase [Plasticicumulans acidivorans]|uniref:DNA 3'-5' helicase n=1 Tax=Plasticicumulans acidivorans TaxID=886464 RepID=A0A317MYM4_9GAMM|nr:RecQ family ATP-dependent DNA helicase [Plasticicumulans acidivorans]PWV64743.1 ATP-dependent DNA helicase RecQ [Plasticicumulans acidivorans]
METLPLLDDALWLDFEATPDGRLFAIGALWRGAEFRRGGAGARFDQAEALAALAEFGREARWLLGHNLLDHDLPLLRALAPAHPLLALPVLDTLYLSPLAHPENPYHALVKDYKLVRSAANDPLADARLSAQLFREQYAALAEQARADSAWIDLLYHVYRDAELGREGASAAAFVALWQQLGACPQSDVRAALRQLLDGRVCRQQWLAVTAPLLADARQRPLLGWLVAWLRVAGGNSVLPPWLRLRFPQLGEIVRRLRDQPCRDPECRWCRSAHSPQEQLKHWFDYDAFRAEPAAADGSSLQQAIVSHAMAGGSLLGILPTGGGKSLCFQLPALALYQRRGALSVVVSPLRALMKDQVDGLTRRLGAELAGALYGELTPPERGALLERVRLGDIALLYVAPEQFRNPGFAKVLASREIGLWIFDEAHCLAKWGHDFRTDYLYCARFIREFNTRHPLQAAPVLALTATAKPEVVDEIREHFRRELSTELALFPGGTERANLRFAVQEVSEAEKYPRIDGLLREHLGTREGAAVVYCTTRKHSEQTAEFLAGQDWAAQAFHAGLEAPRKRAIQEAFLRGETQVICATNAFGMGIDKENVRLVVHADVPGSLENYLQEAGRAGRDRADADCVLLFAKDDVERQFLQSARSELRQGDIVAILRALRRLQQKHPERPVVTTAGELLNVGDFGLSFDADERDADTRVRMAIAWLERAGFVSRDENHIRVFQGVPLVRSLLEARDKMAQLKLPQAEIARWEAVLLALWQCAPDEGLSTDELAQLPALRPQDGTPPKPILRLLDDMQRAGLLRAGLQLSAWVQPRGGGGRLGAKARLEQIIRIERALLELLREAAPDAAEAGWQPLELRLLNQRLCDAGLPSDTELLRKLLGSLARDGLGLAERQIASLKLRAAGHERLQIWPRRSWDNIVTTASVRHGIATLLLDCLLRRVADGPGSGETLVEFGLEDLRAVVATDLLLGQQLRDPLAAIECALLYLHEQRIIVLQQGLAVFRSAMTVRVLPEARGRRYGAGDYAPLGEHYRERILQIHVMAEYARLALQEMQRALALLRDYFEMERKSFIRRYFAGREQELKRPTAPESFYEIVEALGNPLQQAIVAAPAERNLLILAGPGSGKSRVVVHRVAYLLRVLRVPPRAVLVLCYNHHAALDLRRRLLQLIGREARAVTVRTFHGLALALCGRALDGQAREEIDFGALLSEATALLNGERELIGAAGDELRERLLAGYQHILVDEYQDIDAQQYALISALAGRTLDEGEHKLSILAVGDDDQNIYAFREASVEFIRRFATDYAAEQHFLVENYRSSAHIIAAANRLIAHNRERMKTAQPIRIDQARAGAAAGGAWGAGDPLTQGRVQILRVADGRAQARAVAAELQRLHRLDPALAWERCAVLARTRQELLALRAALDHLGIPLRWNAGKDELPSPWRVCEIVDLLDRLRAAGLGLVELQALVAPLPAALPWRAGLVELFAELAAERAAPVDGADDDPAAAPAGIPAALLLDALTQWLDEARRGLRHGAGVYLGSAHSAKGLEFDHVIVLGDWRVRGEDHDAEAERRLYYVAMTRARASLTLCARADALAPALVELRAGDCLERTPALVELPPAVLDRRIERLTFEDLYLSYAANFAAGAPIHAALAAAQPGDAVSLQAVGEQIFVLDVQGRRLARLSKKACQQWAPRLENIIRARLLALVWRREEDEEEPSRGRRRLSRWRLPWVEIVVAG